MPGSISVTSRSAFYGYSVSNAGDVNGDGYADVIIGARSMTEVINDEGIFQVWGGSPTGIDYPFIGFGNGGETLSWYGASVANAGDVNGDGYDDVIIGAPKYGTTVDNPPNDQGKVVVYYGGGRAGVSLLPRQTSFLRSDRPSWADNQR